MCVIQYLTSVRHYDKLVGEMTRTAQTAIRISARVPEDLLKGLERIHPHENISFLLRSLMEKEIRGQKTLKAHLKLYGRFSPRMFNESIL